jgi:gamma-glutamyltranspeptidase/glutathione hydrolase
MATSAASSTRQAAAHAASQVLLAHAAEPGLAGPKAPARAVDAVVAGVLALAARVPSVLLGAGVVMIGGVGEGRVVIDGRARQPGLGVPRPRGWKKDDAIPDAARIAVPGLPGALVLAHAGRGELTLSELSRIAIASAEVEGALDPLLEQSIRAFGREGALAIRSGTFRAPLLRAAPRSLGGLLSEGDLDAATAARLEATEATRGASTIAHLPWADDVARALSGESVDAEAVDHAIVAAADVHGGLAIAAVAVPSGGVALEGTGLVAPTLAEPVRRNETRVQPGTTLAFSPAIALVRGRVAEGATSFAIGVTSTDASARSLARAVERLCDGATLLDDAIAVPGVVSGVAVDAQGRSRPLSGRR